MCGRYVSVSTPEQLAEAFDVGEVRTEPLPGRYNVAPTLDVYAVIQRDDVRRLGTLRWGFVPFWAKQLKGSPSPINARIEGLADNRMFGRAVESRRCIIPADAFYEWQDRAGARKQPYVFRDPDGAPLAFAGLWSSWRDPEAGDDAERLHSCAIVTMPAKGPVADIHDRMPAMLPPQLVDDWLTASPEDAPHLLDAVAALGVPRIERYAVSDRVNNVRNEGPELLEPGEVD
ncbi:MAG: SOS response-associated peptidase [Actinobacteria bacterium]|nr:SOS response-associated peptidase [Actinomycetota bacterium]